MVSRPFPPFLFEETGSPRGNSLILHVRGFAAGQGLVFDLSVLNRVYNFVPGESVIRGLSARLIDLI